VELIYLIESSHGFFHPGLFGKIEIKKYELFHIV
jgi:hypothetical protein